MLQYVVLLALAAPLVAVPVDVLCATGNPCHFTIPMSSSTGISVGDQAMVKSACDGSNETIAGWPNTGISKPAEAAGDGADLYISWPLFVNGTGEQALVPTNWTVTPGTYRVCWCNQSTGLCQDGEGFLTDLGSVTLAGINNANPQQHVVVCVRGQACSVVLAGVALAQDDRYTLLSTGSLAEGSPIENGTEAEGNMSDGFVNFTKTTTYPAGAIGGNETRLSWDFVSADPGPRNLSWAPVWFQPSAKNCSELGWNSTSRASPAICAGRPNNCSMQNATFAGSQCTAIGARLCLPHEVQQQEAVAVTACGNDSGVELHWTGRPCTDTAYVAISSSASDPNPTCTATEVLRPWFCCADVEGGSANARDAQAGLVAVRGPRALENYCVIGETCKVTLPGFLFNQSADMLQAIPGNASCGNASVAPSSADFVAPRTSPWRAEDTTEIFVLGEALTFDTFTMCWCGIADVGCRSSEDYNVLAGYLLVGGIVEQSLTCVVSLPCKLVLPGTNLGEADAVLIIPASQTCSMILERRADPVVEVQVNPAFTKDASSNSLKTFELGSVTVHGYMRICYCINFGSRSCEGSDGAGINSDHFGTSAGLVYVYGPQLNATLPLARTGTPYRVAFTGVSLTWRNRISIVEASGGELACGSNSSNGTDAAVTIPSDAPTSTHIDLVSEFWDGVLISRAGEYYVCWCAGDSEDEGCASGSRFVLAGSLSVGGLWGSVDYPSQKVGNPFSLVLHGRDLAQSDSLLIVPETLASSCGVGLQFDYGEQALVTDAVPSLLDGVNATVRAIGQVWTNVVVKSVGTYLACWCGREACTSASYYYMMAARVQITGPELTTLRPVTAGDRFSISLAGTSLSSADRIAIVHHTVSCGTQAADRLADVVIPSVSGASASQHPTAADAIGAPSKVSMDGTMEVWQGITVRWQGVYKICWAGNHTFSRYCVTPDGAGGCSHYESAYMPYYVGDLHVQYGPVVVTAQRKITRCDSLDLGAVPPNPTFPDGTVLSSEWSCEPDGELCRSLYYDGLAQGADQLSLHVPPATIASSMDRARFVAAGLGLTLPNVHVTIVVTMVDAQNVTRRGSAPVEISNSAPVVMGFPMEQSIYVNEQLQLTLHVAFPTGEGGACALESSDGFMSAASITSTTWQLVGGPALGKVDLQSETVSANPQQLVLPVRSVSALGIGVHTISAMFTYTESQDQRQVLTSFTVQVSELPPPVVRLIVPSTASAACPLVLDASGSYDPVLPSIPLVSYSWWCIAPENAPCAADMPPSEASSTAATSGLRVLQLASPVKAGAYQIGVRVATADGREASTIMVANVLTASASWAGSVVDPPRHVAAGQGVDCFAAGACDPPDNSSWSLTLLTGTSVTTGLETTQQEIAGQVDALRSVGAVVQPSMLSPGSRYRCILRAGDELVLSTNDFEVARAPRDGRVVVTPSAGVALDTRFSLASLGWVSSHLPLEHSFMAVEGAAPQLQQGIDPSRVIMGWSQDDTTTTMLALPHAGIIRVVARVRDVLGSLSQASSEVELQKSSKLLDQDLDLVDLADWPPSAQSVTSAAAAVLAAVGASSSGANTSANEAHKGLLAPLFDGLWSGVQLSAAADVSSADLALRAWVLEAGLGLAGTPSQLSVGTNMVAARVLAVTAEHSATHASTAQNEPLTDQTAQRLLSAAAFLVSTRSTEENHTHAVERMELLRSTARDLGGSLLSRKRRHTSRGLLQDGAALVWEGVQAENMSLATVDVPRAELIGRSSTLASTANGVRFSLQGVPTARRLGAGARGLCNAESAGVQLVRWPASPMAPSPFQSSGQPVFDGWLTGMHVRPSEELPGSAQHFATVQLNLCPEGSLRLPGVIVRFTIRTGVGGTVYNQEKINGSTVFTYSMNASWTCLQWDNVASVWRGSPAMRLSGSDTTLECVSTLATVSSNRSEDHEVVLAAVPVARATLLAERPVNPEPEGPEFQVWRLQWLFFAIVLAQVPLVILCALDAWDVAGEREALADASKDPDRVPPLACLPDDSLESAERMCALRPGCLLYDGLVDVAPRFLFVWPCTRRRDTSIINESSSVIVPESDPEDAAVEEAAVVMPSIDQPHTVRRRRTLLVGLESSDGDLLQADPPLRQDVEERARRAQAAQTQLTEQRMERVALGGMAACWGYGVLDLQEKRRRTLMRQCLVEYRRLYKRSLNDMGIAASPPDAADTDDTAERALGLRVAHHLQAELLRTMFGAGARLAPGEESSIGAAQRTLQMALESCDPATPTEPLDAKFSGSTVAPYFAPPLAHYVVLLAIDPVGKKQGESRVTSKSSATSRRVPTKTSATSRRVPTKTSATSSHRAHPEGASSFAPILPHGAETSMADDVAVPGWFEGDAHSRPQTASAFVFEDDPQPWLVGCAYYVWTNGRMLYLHRAETVIHDTKAPKPLDHTLSRYEKTHGYQLERDVVSLQVLPDDDRYFDLHLRGNRPRLRFRGDGELRAWTESLNREQVASGDMDHTDLQDLMVQPSMRAGGATAQSTFFYSAPSVPHTACNAFVETTREVAAPTLAWYSHGGAALSFAIRPGSDFLRITDHAELPSGIGDEAVELQADACKHIKCVGIYVSDVTTIAHEVREETEISRFRLSVALADGQTVRLCFSLRFPRILFQFSLMRLRAAVCPESPPIDVDPARHRMIPPKSAASTTSSGWPKKLAASKSNFLAIDDGTKSVGQHSHRTGHSTAPAKEQTLQQGLSGCLDVTILSASRLGCEVTKRAHDFMQGAKSPSGVLAVYTAGDQNNEDGKPKAKPHLPLPQACIYVPAQPTPRKPEFRKTPEHHHRTANPIWNCTWRFTVEYFEGDVAPHDIRVEVWDVGGRGDFLGEAHIPFPMEAGTNQLCLKLMPNPARAGDSIWKVTTGCVSLQLTWVPEENPAAVEHVHPCTWHIDPDDTYGILCGSLRVEVLQGFGLNAADFLSSDPYCLLNVSDAPRHLATSRTCTRHGTVNPVWCEAHEFWINWPKEELDSAPPVKVHIFDHDKVGSDEFLGEASFALPQGPSEHVVDIKLKENRALGCTEVKGSLQLRVAFTDQFQMAVGHESSFSDYEQAFCDYFGTRPVDEVLARSLAPLLKYFHFSVKRVVMGHLDRAWQHATFGLLRLGGEGCPVVPRSPRRAPRYVELVSSLWAALAVAAPFVLIFKGIGGGIVIGIVVGTLMPSPAHVMVALCWHRHPAASEGYSSAQIQPIRTQGDSRPPVGGIVAFSVGVELAAWIVLAIVLGNADEDEAGMVALVAGILLLMRLCLRPLLWGMLKSYVVVKSKVTPTFDWWLTHYPSLLTAHGVTV